jgi:hypothetical protein
MWRKVLAEVAPSSESISVGVVDAEVQDKAVLLRVLTVDDSSVARKQVSRCLQTVGGRSGGAQRWSSGAGLPAQAGR